MTFIESLSVSTISEHEREFLITVTKECVNKEYNRALNSIQMHATRPGFRPGKMPKSMVEKFFPDKIKSILSERLVEESLNEALKKEDLIMVSKPVLEELSDANLEKPFSYKAIFQVKPKISINKYQGLSISAPRIVVNEEDMNTELGYIQEMFATFQAPVDRDVICENDKALVEIKTDSWGPAQEEISMFSPSLPPGTKEALIGKKIGEEAIVKETNPDKELVITFKVISIKERVLPKLDDELAKDYSPQYETLQQLKDDVSERLKKTAERRNEYYLNSAIKKALLEGNPVSVPPALIERVAASMAQEQLKSIKKDYIQELQKNWDKYWEATKTQSEQQIKVELLFEELFKKLNIKANDEKIADISSKNKDLDKESIIFNAQADELLNIIKNDSKITYIDEPLYNENK